jgi:iron complex transport system ATP-binding protein
VTGAPSAISLDGLFFSYGPALPDALRNVSLEIPAQAVTAILGPNGSGKTTLLHLLLGLLAPRSGRVMLGDRPHDAYTRRELSRLVGLVPQSEHVPFDLSVIEYVLLGRAPYLGLLELPQERDRHIALQALEAAGVAALSERTVPSLSGGERQLTTVARALAQEPRILLLDEPTSHLDLKNTRRVLRVLRALCDDGRTVVFTTHDPNAAASLADHVVLLKEGRVLAAGPTEQVFNSRYLTETYDVEVEVIRANGRLWVLVH